jgi:hypothetical protein
MLFVWGRKGSQKSICYAGKDSNIAEGQAAVHGGRQASEEGAL